ncbi:MAG: glycosyltransferase family 4 protein [Proteobacteria bacterium]|nr:glycosyltransferase family 4 protein [Pseudomonadota bacterium]
MRICFVGLDSLPVLAPEYQQHRIGGEQVQQTLLARALARRGFEVSMLVYDYGQQDGQRWDGVTTHRAFAESSGLPLLRFLHPRWTGLVRAARRADADVYYLSCASTQVGQMALHAHRRGRKMLFRVASDADCDPHNLLIKYWRDKKLYEYGLRRADAVLVQSAAQQVALRRNYGVESTIAGMLVEDPAALAAFSARDIAVLWVSNIRQVKRPDRMLEFARSTPDVDVHMVGGRLPDAGALYELVQQQGAALPNLNFHGQLPYAPTFQLYGRARVFANTSDVEGFPNTYLQSWRNGTPVVGYFDPDGLIAREGLGYAVDNLDDMRAAVRRLASDPVEWQQCSARCLAFMEREFGTDKVLQPYLAAIAAMTGGAAP